MRKQTIQEYLDLHYEGDRSRVKFVKLDYSAVRTPSDLVAWAISTFDLPVDSQQPDPDPYAILNVLFRHLGERKQHYIVLESFPRHITPEVERFLTGDRGWQQALGFHLSRDYRVQVCFFQDPETKGQQPRTTH